MFGRISFFDTPFTLPSTHETPVRFAQQHSFAVCGGDSPLRTTPCSLRSTRLLRNGGILPHPRQLHLLATLGELSLIACFASSVGRASLYVGLLQKPVELRSMCSLTRALISFFDECPRSLTFSLLDTRSSCLDCVLVPLELFVVGLSSSLRSSSKPTPYRSRGPSTQYMPLRGRSQAGFALKAGSFLGKLILLDNSSTKQSKIADINLELIAVIKHHFPLKSSISSKK